MGEAYWIKAKSYLPKNASATLQKACTILAESWCDHKPLIYGTLTGYFRYNEDTGKYEYLGDINDGRTDNT